MFLYVDHSPDNRSKCSGVMKRHERIKCTISIPLENIQHLKMTHHEEVAYVAVKGVEVRLCRVPFRVFSGIWERLVTSVL